MKRIVIALALVMVLLASLSLTAQRRSPQLDRDAARVKKLAKKSKALRKLILQKDSGLRKEILSNKKLRLALDKDRNIRERLARDKESALKDSEFLEKLLKRDDVVNHLLAQKEVKIAFQDELKNYQRALKDARNSSKSGAHRMAVSQYEAATNEARRIKNPHAEAQALIYGARELEAIGDRHVLTADKKRALAWYDSAIRIGDTQQQALARNNKGVALLETKDSAGALTVLREIDLNQVDKFQRPLFRYNLGRALEREGAPLEARQEYSKVLAEKPDFRPASDSVFRLLLQSKDKSKVKDAAAQVDQLTSGKQIRISRANAKKCLTQWRADADAPLLCKSLIRNYRVSGIRPRRFARKEKPYFKKLAESSKDMKPFADAMMMVYEGKLEIAINNRKALSVFPYWERPEMKAEWAKLLRATADKFDNRGDSEQALARYLLSWKLDQESTESLVYIAELFRQNPKLLVKQPAVFEALIDRVMVAKGIAYSNSYTSSDEWTNIRRYHILLGTIFENQRKWGGPKTIRSAIFQFERAIWTRAKIEKASGTRLGPAPGLHYRAGKAWHHRKDSSPDDRDRAYNHYIRATQIFIKRGNASEAMTCLDAASKVKLSKDRRLLGALRNLKTEIRKIRQRR
ncbi:MAG: hypothetical protein V3W41_17275 [Planctomycetota bacterium]